MPEPLLLPEGLVHARTTDVLDHEHHPAGLLRAHRVAAGVWAQLVVRSGSLVLVYEDRPDERLRASVDAPIVIPPGRPHHVEFEGPVSFVIEFFRTPTAATPDAGAESGGLIDDSPPA